MKWNIVSKTCCIHNNSILTANVTLTDNLISKGVFFAADSLPQPSTGLYFSISTNGFCELFLHSDNETHSICKRKSPAIKAGQENQIIMILKDGIGSFFLSPDSSSWPVMELPLPISFTGNAAIVSDREEACVAEDASVDTLSISGIEENTNSTSKMYQNPVLLGYADPDILYYQGLYYMYATSSTLPVGYEVYTSEDLVNWSYGGVVMKEIWGMKRWYWAPDIMERNGRFYMLVSVNEHLGIAVSTSPMGPFIPQPDFLFDHSIDGHFFVDEDGKVYIYYVSWRDGKKYALYGMEMESDCVTPKLMTETLILSAAEDWECQKAPVAEAPYMLKHNGLYYLTYSGSHFESIGYAVGYATAKSPLGPFTKYTANPILSYHYKTHGPGHHCITTSPDQKELFLVYHTHHDLTTVSPRNICIDRMRFTQDGEGPDRLEVYGPSVLPMPYPSGC